MHPIFLLMHDFYYCVCGFSTANGSEQFEIVERIPAFDKITLTKWGPQVELKTVLYIIRKNYEE